ncbi:nucleoside-triphosphatase [Tepidanaerobacter syntrophicus]|uniref:nucleoside-triphosphatase n=1 Tax=Tepidanaerobacter syntrophicus TaxID=224999 RepID=UPI001BD55FF9|nr:nucleoside-triphosphatase [Tepidanaerobacter syntrophicus]
MGYKNLLLQGDIGIGKSTIIIDAIMPYIDYVGGYYTQRILKNKQKAGFLINPIKNIKVDGLNRDIKDIKPEGRRRLFIYKNSNGTWSFDNEVFTYFSIKYLSKGLQQCKKLLIADELGGMEFQRDDFLQEVVKIFLSDVPVLGVLKSYHNFQKLAKNILLKTTYKNVEQFKNLVNQKTQIILLAPGENKNQVVSQVQAFVKKSITAVN